LLLKLKKPKTKRRLSVEYCTRAALQLRKWHRPHAYNTAGGHV